MFRFYSRLVLDLDLLVSFTNPVRYGVIGHEDRRGEDAGAVH